ncbi:hypothetical protein CBS76997_11201 [Aspergillus niger]|nr:hypothetical protein CBS13152_11165 [Aspergillus niger]KAI2867916.1 hypothetical protein CBS11852_11416 [Aspergillus niger]KAI2947526.1 hypothetical protein CBS147323_11182 [Aspergillus niger]KAI3034123.1 hypothetical protein CBS76997_11201 [Aspergillus niger]
MATAHRRRQLSLTWFIHLPLKPLLTLEECQIARSLFKTLIDYAPERTSRGRYKPTVPIEETFGRIQCKDVFLEYFFTYIYTNVIPEEERRTGSGFSQVFTYFRDFSSWSSKNNDTAMDTIHNFAEYLINNSFMPLRASSVKTPQPTPVALPANQNAPTGIKSRVSRLRQECLKRDHYRCVVSRKFDRAEAKKRLEQDENSKDDDGEFSRNQKSDQLEYLEVAHIIPHSLATVSSEESELSESKKAALYILDMFDPPDIGPLIAGPEIDSPYNALTLTHNYHRLFGEFEIYFEQKDPTIECTYVIGSSEQRPYLRDQVFPVTGELHLGAELTIDPPASKLLKVHCAIAHILKLSGAGEYIERTLREMTEICVSADGSTDLGRRQMLLSGSQMIGADRRFAAGISANHIEWKWKSGVFESYRVLYLESSACGGAKL